MQSIHLDAKDFRCVVRYDSYYDMYCGATIVDDQLGIVNLVDCQTYSSQFRAKPHLVSPTSRKAIQNLTNNPQNVLPSGTIDDKTV